MSIDQCSTCTARGDLTKCHEAECSLHDSWVVVALTSRMLDLEISNNLAVKAHIICDRQRQGFRDLLGEALKICRWWLDVPSIDISPEEADKVVEQLAEKIAGALDNQYG